MLSLKKKKRQKRVGAHEGDTQGSKIAQKMP